MIDFSAERESEGAARLKVVNAVTDSVRDVGWDVLNVRSAAQNGLVDAAAGRPRADTPDAATTRAANETVAAALVHLPRIDPVSVLPPGGRGQWSASR
jgi:hypothetical protein